jgi:hypothetical protein
MDVSTGAGAMDGDEAARKEMLENFAAALSASPASEDENSRKRAKAGPHLATAQSWFLFEDLACQGCHHILSNRVSHFSFCVKPKNFWKHTTAHEYCW